MRKNYLLTLCIAFAIFSNAQIVLEPGKVVEQFQKASITIELIHKSKDLSKSKPILIGSGFLVLKNKKSYAITNAHVHHVEKNDYIIVIGINTKVGKVYGEVEFICEDLNKDIAVFKHDGKIFTNKEVTDTVVTNQLNIGISYFAKDNEIIPGNFIVSIGYPLNLGWDSLENNPIVRSGIVAQKVQKNGKFLIDGMSNPGNSGSPVFDVNNTKLIGMISSGPSDRIAAYDENRNLIASLPYNSGLTICIAASEILKLIP